MEKIKALILLPFLLLFLCLTNCYYYKTIEQSSTDYEAIKNTQATNPAIFMQNSYSSALYKVEDFAITDSTFSGNAHFTIGVHENDANSFRKKKSKEVKYKIDPLQSIHIVLKSDSMINEGYFELPLSDIKSVKFHDKDKSKSTGSAVAWVFLGIGAAVGMFFLAWSLAWSGAL
jgi:hypothetical protein